MLVPTEIFAPIEKAESFRWRIKKKYHRVDKARIRKAHFSGIMLDPSAGLFPGKRGPVAVFDANDLNAKLTQQNLRSRNILSIWRINL